MHQRQWKTTLLLRQNEMKARLLWKKGFSANIVLQSRRRKKDVNGDIDYDGYKKFEHMKSRREKESDNYKVCQKIWTEKLKKFIWLVLLLRS